MVSLAKHYGMEVFPKDKHGAALKPLDLVIIRDLPTYYTEDKDLLSTLKYIGAYGMVNYLNLERFYGDHRDIPGWGSPNGSWVHVDAVGIRGDSIAVTDFVLPPSCLERIPYNYFIMSAFANYPWRIQDDDGPSDHPFVVRGVEQFDHVARVLSTPYERLVEAHEVVCKSLWGGNA
jgi:hypothetical protein